MSRKKQPQTYNDMARLLEDVMERMGREKHRMSQVLSDALLDDKAIGILGGYSDADLRRIMKMVAADIGNYAARLEAEKRTCKTGKVDRGLPIQPDQDWTLQQVAQFSNLTGQQR